MEKILLLCDLGITTSKLVNDLNTLAKENNIDFEMNSCPISDVGNKGREATMLMLSPQVRFNYNKVKHMFPDKVVMKIGDEDFITMNSFKIFKDILEKMK